jgi:hypothetical protein
LAAIADQLATKPVGRPKGKSAKLHKYQDAQEKPTETPPTPTVEQAADAVGVSKRSVQTYREIKEEEPDTATEVRKGKKSLATASKEVKARKRKKGKPKAKPPKGEDESITQVIEKVSAEQKPFDDAVKNWIEKQVQRFPRHRENIYRALVTYILGASCNGVILMPEKVTYFDGTVITLGKLLQATRRLRLKSDTRASKKGKQPHGDDALSIKFKPGTINLT